MLKRELGEIDLLESSFMNRETKIVRGAFEVVLTEREPPDTYDQDRFDQMGIDKTFTGELTGRSRGEMLAVQSVVEGSAGYVAIEIVEGELDGLRGGFVLQHSSFINRGVPEQNVKVIPDSGTDELEGLEGSMTIDIDQSGAHRYTFEYTVAS